MGSNERLHSAMSRRRLTTGDLADVLLVDRKTVERWLSGRTPHSRHREAVARRLKVRSDYLWPDAGKPTPAPGPGTTGTEIVALYPSRANVPDDLWRDLANSAHEHIDVLVYAGLFLPELDPSLVPSLETKAAAGCTVRIALGDPDSTAVQLRGDEEGTGDGMAARVRMALGHYQPIVDADNVEVRQHKTTLYNSIYRFDDEVLVNTHAWGSKAFKSPVLHLRRVQGGSLFDTYATSFEAVWATTSTYTG